MDDNESHKVCGVKVAVRVRKLINRELLESENCKWLIHENTICQENRNDVPYTFDTILTPQNTNEDVYEDIAKDLVLSAMGGINCTIFAYGQTSSGKTHTMMGSDREPGVIPRAVNDIFKYCREKASERSFLLRISYMEIYKEKIIDLLNANKTEHLKVRENIRGEVYVKDLLEEVVQAEDDIYTSLQKGEQLRHFAATNMNDRSSRSHTIFRITIESTEKGCEAVSKDTARTVRVSQMNFVDLAGSERIKQTGADGIRLKEGAHINTSLAVLSRVIKKLSEPNPENNVIPFRESKLTRILQSSLGGNAATCVLCTVTPAAVEETHSTLRFAKNAKLMKNKPIINEVMNDKALISKYEKRIRALERQLEQKNQLESVVVAKDSEIQNLKSQLVGASNTTRKARRETFVNGPRGLIPSPRNQHFQSRLTDSFESESISKILDFDLPPLVSDRRCNSDFGIKQLEDETVLLRAAYEKEKARSERLTRDFKELEDMCTDMGDRMQDHIDEQQEQIDKLTTENEETSQKLREMEKILVAAGLERQDMMAELGDTKSKLNAQMERNAFILTEAEEQRVQLEGRIKSLTDSLSDDAALCSPAKRKRSSNISSAEETLKSQIETLNIEIKSKSALLEDSKDEIQMLTAALSQRTHDHDAHLQSIREEMTLISDKFNAEAMARKLELEEKDKTIAGLLAKVEGVGTSQTSPIPLPEPNSRSPNTLEQGCNTEPCTFDQVYMVPDAVDKCCNTSLDRVVISSIDDEMQGAVERQDRSCATDCVVSEETTSGTEVVPGGAPVGDCPKEDIHSVDQHLQLDKMSRELSETQKLMELSKAQFEFQIAEMAKDRDHYERKCHELSDEVLCKCNILNELKKNLKANECEIEELKKKLVKLETVGPEESSLQKDYAKAVALTNELQERCSALEAEYAPKQRAFDDVSKMLDDMTTEKKELLEKVESLENILEKKTVVINSLQERTKSSDTSTTTGGSVVHDDENRTLGLKQEIIRLQNELEAQTNLAEKLSEEISNVIQNEKEVMKLNESRFSKEISSLNNQLEEHIELKSKLEKRIDDLETEVQSKVETANELTGKVSQLHEKLLESSKDVETLRNALNNRHNEAEKLSSLEKEKIRVLEQQLESKKDEAEQLRLKCEGLVDKNNTTVRELQERYATLENECFCLKAAHQEAQNGLECFSAEKVVLLEKVTNLEGVLEEKNVLLDSLSKQIKEFHEVAMSTEKQDDRNNQVESVVDLKHKIEQLQIELAAKTSLVSQVNEEASRAIQHEKGMMNQNEVRFSDEISSLNSQLEQHIELKSKLEKRIDDLETEVQSKVETADELTGKVSQLNEKLLESSKDVETLRNALNNRHNEAEKLSSLEKEKIGVLEQQLESKKDEAEQLRLKCEGLVDKNNTTVRELQERYATLENEYSCLKAAHQEAEMNLKKSFLENNLNLEKIKSLEHVIEKKENLFDRLQTQMKQVEMEVSVAQGTAEISGCKADFEQTISNLEKDLKIKAEEVDRLNEFVNKMTHSEDEVFQLHEKILILEEEISSLTSQLKEYSKVELNLKQQISELKAEAHLNTNTSENVASEISQLNDKLSEKSKFAASLQSKLSNIEEEMRKSITMKDAELERLEEQLKNEKSGSELLRQNCDELMDSLRQKERIINEKNESRQIDNCELQQSIKEKDSIILEREATIEDKIQELIILTDHIKELEIKEDRATIENEKLKQDLAEAHASYTKVNSEKKALEEDISNMVNGLKASELEIACLRSNAQQTDAEKESKYKECRELESQLEKVTEDYAVTQSELADLRVKSEAAAKMEVILNEKITHGKALLESLTQEKIGFEKDFYQLREENAKMNATILNLKQDLEAARRNAQHKVTELEFLTKEFLRVSTDHETAQKAFDEKLNTNAQNHSLQMKELKAEQERIDGERKELKVNLTETYEKLKKLEEKYEIADRSCRESYNLKQQLYDEINEKDARILAFDRKFDECRLFWQQEIIRRKYVEQLARVNPKTYKQQTLEEFMESSETDHTEYLNRIKKTYTGVGVICPDCNKKGKSTLVIAEKSQKSPSSVRRRDGNESGVMLKKTYEEKIPSTMNNENSNPVQSPTSVTDVEKEGKLASLKPGLATDSARGKMPLRRNVSHNQRDDCKQQ